MVYSIFYLPFHYPCPYKCTSVNLLSTSGHCGLKRGLTYGLATKNENRWELYVCPLETCMYFQ